MLPPSNTPPLLLRGVGWLEEGGGGRVVLATVRLNVLVPCVSCCDVCAVFEEPCGRERERVCVC